MFVQHSNITDSIYKSGLFLSHHDRKKIRHKKEKARRSDYVVQYPSLNVFLGKDKQLHFDSDATILQKTVLTNNDFQYEKILRRRNENIDVRHPAGNEEDFESKEMELDVRASNTKHGGLTGNVENHCHLENKFSFRHICNMYKGSIIIDVTRIIVLFLFWSKFLLP